MNEDFFADAPIMTYLVCAIVGIIAVIGGIVTIANPDALSFQEYVDALWKLAIAAAGLGVGRAYLKGKKAEVGLLPEQGAGRPPGGDPEFDPAAEDDGPYMEDRQATPPGMSPDVPQRR